MKLSKNIFKHDLRTDKKQIGLWVSLSNPFAAEVVATAGFDWALLDMEHSPNELTAVMGQLQVFEATGTEAMVRPDWNDAVLVKRLLDIGARSFLFPMIQTVEEAERAVAATRYPPRGIRGVSLATRANAFARVTDYFERADEEIAVVVQVETASALAQAEDIAAVDGVDGVFFGPADIGADLGKLGKPMDDAVWDAVMPVARALIAKGVPVGTLVMDTAFAAKLLEEGFSFVACGSDSGLLARGADRLLADMKGRLA